MLVVDEEEGERGMMMTMKERGRWDNYILYLGPSRLPSLVSELDHAGGVDVLENKGSPSANKISISRCCLI